MISDQEIIIIITTRSRGGQIYFSTNPSQTQYLVDDKHEWDFKNNTYVVTRRWKKDDDKIA